MRLPRGFRRDRLKGERAGGAAIVHFAGHAVVIPQTCVRHPGGVRKRLEAVLKEHLRRAGRLAKSKKSAEEIVTAEARRIAALRRRFKNDLAAGLRHRMPWTVPRTVKAIADEQKLLDRAEAISRMGEYKR